ncbi:MAG: hypothetical protein NBV55_02015 [Polynucleobacter sp.]|nr:hypothetical protein [Polynucleobacter sp.]
MNTNTDLTNLIEECFSGKDINQIKKNLDNFDKRFERFEIKMTNVVNENILLNDRKLSDIWSTAYLNLLDKIYETKEIYGFWILIHIIHNSELYSDQTKVNSLKEYLDTKFNYEIEDRFESQES